MNKQELYKLEVIEKHLKVNGKIIKDGDIVRFNCGKNNYEYCGYFYIANDLNKLFCDFLISDKRKEDWGFWDGYLRGFNFDEVKNFVKEIEGLI